MKVIKKKPCDSGTDPLAYVLNNSRDNVWIETILTGAEIADGLTLPMTKCSLYGTVRVDNTPCMEFQPAD